jgi:hypothetical protein
VEEITGEGMLLGEVSAVGDSTSGAHAALSRKIQPPRNAPSHFM